MASNAVMVAERALTPAEMHAAFIEEKRAEIIRTFIPKDFQQDTAVIGMFLDLCKARGLNPFAKQIYCVKRSGKASIEPSIDGLRLIAARTGVFAGVDEYEYDNEAASLPTWARCTVYRLVGGLRCAFSHKVLWKEFGAKEHGASYDNQYKHRPFHMLGLRAEGHALRKAFPEETSGLYTHEEMEADASRARFVDEDGVIHEPDPARTEPVTLPLSMSAAMWASIHAEATAHGIELSPLMTGDEIVGAIRKAGGPPIPGVLSAGAIRYALKHMPVRPTLDANTPEEAHLRAIANEEPPAEGTYTEITEADIAAGQQQASLIGTGR